MKKRIISLLFMSAMIMGVDVNAMQITKVATKNADVIGKTIKIYSTKNGKFLSVQADKSLIANADFATASSFSVEANSKKADSVAFRNIATPGSNVLQINPQSPTADVPLFVSPNVAEWEAFSLSFDGADAWIMGYWPRNENDKKTGYLSVRDDNKIRTSNQDAKPAIKGPWEKFVIFITN